MIPDVNEIKALGKFYTLNKQQLYPFTNDSQVTLPYIYIYVKLQQMQYPKARKHSPVSISKLEPFSTIITNTIIHDKSSNISFKYDKTTNTHLCHW